MARLELAGDTLILHVSFLERLGGFVRGDANVPLGSVRAARATNDPWAELRGIRMPGTGLPGKIALGTRRFGGGKDFVAVYGKGPAVIVELAGVEFSRLVVSTGGAEAIAAEINEAAAAAR
ncbi:MAG TPA: hypothetical protein VMV08_11295 [Gaiellaceae bacterium]|nr:hypothetical protein [Gaiellaceae bacterium]